MRSVLIPFPVKAQDLNLRTTSRIEPTTSRIKPTVHVEDYANDLRRGLGRAIQRLPGREESNFLDKKWGGFAGYDRALINSSIYQ